MSEKRTGDSGPPAQMRIRLKYADLPTFIERFAPNVTRGGLFIASRTPKAVGTTLRFELLLADGKTKVLKGEGVVAWVREFDPENPQRPHGMGVRFARLDADSRQLIDRIDAVKRQRGLRDDGAIPQPPPLPAPAPGPTERRGAEEEDADEDAPPSAPARAAAPADTAGQDVEALLSVDGPRLEEALVRARVIAARLIKDGASGDDALERLLVVDVPSLAPPPLAPPPALILPPPPADMAPPPVPAVLPIAAAPSAPAVAAVETESTEPTRVSEPPVMPPHDDPEALEEERTRVRSPTPMSMPIVLGDAEDVADVLDALDRVPPAPGETAAAPPPGPEDTPSQSKPEKKGFFSKLFKK